MVDIQREIKNGFCFGKEEDGLPAIVVSNNGFFVKQDDGTYISLLTNANNLLEDIGDIVKDQFEY